MITAWITYVQKQTYMTFTQHNWVIVALGFRAKRLYQLLKRLKVP